MGSINMHEMPKNVENDYVVILHGIFRTSKHMRSLARHMELQGYEVLNLDYPSTKKPLEELKDHVWQDISSKAQENKPMHFIGYSMGGLLVRAILSHYRPQKMGRVVMLATPNKGSEIADFLKNNWLYKKLYGPAGQQLGTDQTQISSLFKQIDYECGVIAGSRSIDPISSLLIKGKDDGKVSIENTYIEGMQDHITLSAPHTFFPQNKNVQQQTAYFLREGSFKK